MSTPEQDSLSKIRVILIDDSAVIRGLMTRILQEDSDIEVVGSYPNGLMGLHGAEKAKPDIVILDVEMPVMDGITALPKILNVSPDTKVLMCSSLTMRNAEITLKAMSLGATDCIAKPTSTSDISGQGIFREHLVTLIKSLIKKRGSQKLVSAPVQPSPSTSKLHAGSKITLRDQSKVYRGKPSLILIGSSTGGPQALFSVLKSCKDFDVPILITQHMPPTFTTILAQHITSQTGVTAFEGAEGMQVENGKAYIAPGGFHMEITRGLDQILTLHLTSDPPENFCRPSVEPMMRSALKIYGQKILAVILTGMGHDGLQACTQHAENNGRIIAQDEATSVVWGMPGAVATAGLCSAVLPLHDIGPAIKQIMLLKA